MPDITVEKIETFAQEYVTTLANLISDHFSDIMELPFEAGFPIEFPVSVQVFQSDRGFHFYFNKSSCYSFEIVSSIIRDARWSFFLHIVRFNDLIDKAPLLAKSDIEYLYQLPEMMKAHEKQLLEQAERDYVDNALYELDHYFGLLKKSYEIFKKEILVR